MAMPFTHPSFQKIHALLRKGGDSRTRAGWVLLLTAALIGAITIFHGRFVDESDNLVVARLLVSGDHLYADVFSHHYPWAYWWTALVFTLTGPSLAAARASLLIYQLATLAIAMRLSRYGFELGLVAFAWSILRFFYYGNLVLYSGFAGAALLAVFAITLAALVRRIKFTIWHGVAVGAFAAIAFLADPLSVYALVVSFGFLLWTSWRATLVASATAASGIMLAGGYLVATHSLEAFLAQAIDFNANVYSRYLGEGPQRFAQLLKQLTSGLEITDPGWRKLEPLKSFTGTYGDFDRWLFTGFLYRLAILTLVAGLALRKRFLAAAFVYFYVAALLIVARYDFRSQGFILVALFSIALIIGAPPAVRFARTLDGSHFTWNRVPVLGRATMQVVIILLATWLLFRATAHIIIEANNLTYAANFHDMEVEGQRIVEDLACGRSDVVLGYFPGDPLFNWVSGLRPLGRYLFLFPWVAEVALPEVVRELPQTGAIIHVGDETVWSYFPTHKYLAPLLERLDQEYVNKGNGWYVSPDLGECSGTN
ncbi:MAG: hypothetical protein IPK16_20365 [Anaerolineales bacterium]|nr:hypothetical protein [Anaerolineales bacterium]